MSELPQGWAEVVVDDVAASLVDGPFGSNLKTAHYTPEGVRVIRLQNIGDGRFDDRDKAFISEERYQLLRSHDAKPGDVLIAALGDVLPRVCMVPPQLDTAIVKADCFRLRPNSLVDGKYLMYALQSPQVRVAAAPQIAGIGRPRLNLRKVRNLPISLAPLGEQERIVAAIEQSFSGIDSGLSGLERVRRTLRSMRAAVLQSAVNGALSDDSTERWENVTLGDLLDDIHAGKSFKCEERPARPDEWGVVKVSAMTWGQFREDENKTVVGDRIIDPKLEIHPGDLLVSRANTVDYVGAIVLVQECRPQLLLSDKSLRLLPNARVLPGWLVISLRAGSARRYIEAVATGTSDSMRNISQPKLKALQVTLPPLDVQARLVAEVDRMMSQIGNFERVVDLTMRRAAALRSAVLFTAFSGRLVPQDPNDEPVSAMLEQVASERASSNGRRQSMGNHKTRTVRRKVTT